MNTLNLDEAAALLIMHPQTVLQRARAGDIPGAKPGKCWVFIDTDLIEWVRSQYIDQRQDAKQGEIKICYTKEKTAKIIGLNSKSTDEQYKKALEQAIRKKRKG